MPFHVNGRAALSMKLVPWTFTGNRVPLDARSLVPVAGAADEEAVDAAWSGPR